MRKYKAAILNKRKKSILFYCAVALIVIIFVSPFVYVVFASFQSEWAIMTGKVGLTFENFTLQNYIDLLTEKIGVTAFGNNLINSLKVGLSVSLFTIFFAGIGAYGLSRYNLKGKETILIVMLFMYVFPTILAIFPIYKLLSKMNLTDNHLGLILVHTALVAPFCTWLLRSFFDAIPKEIEEAASIDGANTWQIILRIIIPLAAPGILTIAIYAMIYSWGEYTFSSILIDSGTKKTLPLALAAYMSHTDQSWGRLLAGVSLNFVPLVIIFSPLVKNFLKGFTEGAVN